MSFGRVWGALLNSVNFINRNVGSVLPFSALFFLAALMYSFGWYALDVYKDVACLNGNYIIELLFCGAYLGQVGREIVSVTISAFSIIPFAGLIYVAHKILNNAHVGFMDSITENIRGIVKIVVFRCILTIVIFSPFIIYLILAKDIVTQYITETGRLTMGRLLTIGLIPLPLTLLLGFALSALLEPLLQYVEYEVIILGVGLRDAVKNSINLAMKFRRESFVFGFLFIIIWYALIFTKLLYTVDSILTATLFAALFVESVFLFPFRAVALYFLWRELRGEYESEARIAETNKIKSYMGKMLLG